VFFVNLAPLADPVLVPSTIAEVLGVKEEPGKGLLEPLSDSLNDKHLLLVLDNYEHVLDASSVVAFLLDECRELHVLVTSRIPLHLTREHEHAVPPLSVPDPTHLPDLETLSQYESVALFIERAKATKDRFSVTNENAPAVAEICSRLDGLPLAIELAAARIRLLPPQALLRRLSSRLKLLTGGAKDRPSRQQTLRGAIDWSYSLLSPEEQTLFARLSVFAGGCTFEAAEVVCNPEGDVDLLEGMASLVEKSLVQQEEGPDGEPRFRMLETIREYAAEKLEEQEKTEAMRGEHARYFLELPKEVGVGDPGQWKPEHPHGLKRLETELDNLRAALTWCQARGEGELGLHSISSLFWLWEVRGFFAEGQRWAKALLAHRDRADRRVQARSLWVAGVMTARAGEYEEAREYFEESLALFREVGDTRGVSWALLWLGNVAAAFGDLERAVALQEAGREVARQDGERWVAAIASHNLGLQARRRGDYTQAQDLHEEALAVYREAGHGSYVGRALYALASLALEQGQLERGRTLLLEAFQTAEQVGDRPMLILCLVATAQLAVRQEEGTRAAWLLGAAEAANARTGAAWDPGNVAEAAHVQLSETAWRTAWQEGWGTPLEQAVAAAAAYIVGQ
jgi:predicted ATPase